jgi:hypothetical protein
MNCFLWPACVQVAKQPSSEEWHITVGLWFIKDVYCDSICSWVFIATRWTVTNWSSLEVVYGLFYESMWKQTFNMLTWNKVIWSTEPIWNICIIWYFSIVINSNNQPANETLVGAKIQTSGHQDYRLACYELSYELTYRLYWVVKHCCLWHMDLSVQL